MRFEREFFALAFGFLAGVVLASFVPPSAASLLFGALLSGALFAFSSYVSVEARRVFVIGVFCFGSTLGLAYTNVRVAGESTMAVHGGETVSLSGIVVSLPEERPKTLHIVVRTEEAPHEKILVILDKFAKVSYGDTLVLRGELTLPKAFASDDGERVFNYPMYLRKDGVRSVMVRPEYEVVQTGGGNPLLAALYAFRARIIERIEIMLVEPHASLASGITLGTREALSDSWRDIFVRTGLIHIVVLSGFNITLFVGMFLFLVRTLTERRRVHFFVGVFGVVSFVLLTGASSTGVRAGIMASIAMLAVLVHRDFNALRALFFAALGMVLWNPFLLVFDPGFQLSVIATFGLVYGTPVFERMFSFIPFAPLREMVSATASTYTWVLPYILYLSGNLSFVAFPTNLLVLPVIPFAMVSVFLGTVLSFLVPALSVWWGAPAYGALSYVLTLSSWASAIPFAATTVAAFSFWWVLIAYVLLGIIFVSVQNGLPEHSN